MNETLEMVTISKKEYENLLRAKEFLQFLQYRGVDNWHGYAYPPDKDDYETLEEWQAAYNEAISSF